jgi:predicted  nucleic acid-binding Zn-ribbon protein|tara:strand:- start:41 stop:2317 length:2277 start_codon:yes stop_codon:yes gene_type:complete
MMAQNLVEYVLDIKTKAAEKGLDNVVDALEDVEKELKKTQRESADTSSSFNKLKKAGMAVGKVTAVMAAVGVAVLAAGKAAFEASKKVTDLVNELNDLSVRSGVSAKTIQGLRQALLSSGQSAEGLNEILGAISGQFAQLGAEGSAVEKKFLSFGVAVRDTNGDLRSNNDILLDSIKLLQGISDSSDRSRASVALFGEAGAKLNQALAAGDFEKFLSFTEKFGIDTGPEASKAAAHFQFVLSGLGTVLNGTLQKFVTATDGQNRFIKGMIKLGGIVAFTGSLVESFGDEIGFVTDKLLDLLKFGIKQTILILTGPFALALGSIINNLELFGIQVDFVNKAMSSLANFTIETVDPTNRLSNAIDKAKADMKEYNEAMEGVNINLDAFGNGATEASTEMNNLGKSTEETTEKIRDLNDVMSDLFRKFVSFNIDKFVSDFAIGFAVIDKIINKSFDASKIDLFANTLRKKLFGQVVQFADTSDPLKIPDMVVEATKFTGFQEFLDKMKLGVAEIFSIAVKGLGRSASKISGALSKGLSAGAALAVTGVLAVLKIAQGLGQRGSTVREVEKSVEEDIRATAKAIELGLQALPRILFNVLPPILIEFIDRLIFGLLKGFAEQFNNVINVFKSLFTREGRQELKAQRDRRQEARGEEFRRRLEQLVNIAGFRSGGRFLPSAKGGIKFTGSDEGLAMLHRGEFVVPETGQMPQAVQRTMGMGQGGMTININAAVVESNAVDELVRQIERRFQTFGSSTSPLFGGR